jgi:hypothetical protein
LRTHSQEKDHRASQVALRGSGCCQLLFGHLQRARLTLSASDMASGIGVSLGGGSSAMVRESRVQLRWREAALAR